MKKKILSKILAGALAAALTVTSVVPAFAASSQEENNTNVATNLAASDVIDTSKTGSITIYKYDMTAASEAGVYTEGTVRSTGAQDTELQTTLYDYAMEGIEFTYLMAGKIEQYSYTTSEGTQLNLVYEIPTELAAILGLDGVTDTDGDTSNNATDMTATGVSAKCETEGVLHYTSQQINDAMSALLEKDDVAAKDALEAYVKGNANAVAMDYTNEYGVTSVDGLALGLYLIVETAVPENVTETVNPFFVSVPMVNLASDNDTTDNDIDDEDGGEYWFYDVYVYPKNQTGNPTFDKMVRNATGAAADEAGESEDMSYIVSNLTDDYADYSSLTDLDGDDDVDADDFAIQRGDAQYSTTNNGVDALAGATDKEDGDGNKVTDNANDGTTEKETDGNGNTTVVLDTENNSENVTGEYQYSSTTTASTNDVLDYILVSKLPHISSSATFLTQYTFVDTLGQGITYNQDAKIAFYTSAADAYINNTANAVDIWTIEITGYDANTGEIIYSDANGYTEVYSIVYDSNSGEETGETKLTIKMTEAGLAVINGNNQLDENGNITPSNGYSDYYMVVYYTATVNADSTVVLGDEGNINDATLIWSRTSDFETYYETLEDECIVYVYGIDLTKTFSDDLGDFSEVEFVLYNKTDGYYVVAEQVMNNDGTGSGVYYVTGKSLTEAEATVFTPNSEGRLIIYGLEGDTYGLTEIATDDRYSILADEMVIVINEASRSIQAAVSGWTGLEGWTEGQQSGKVDMFISDLVAATSSVDSVDATLIGYTTIDGEESANALVKIAVINTPIFKLPQTGGAGLYAVTILGVIAIAAGMYFFFGRKSKKNEKNAAQAQ
ncbi:MAG: LPXTG cell wall anchor domain-containing protein [Lachnospiraceae bacterium]|nr:LPXTG cell wall anchor domain-containing protein [Lachnospiraceae bacterium]